MVSIPLPGIAAVKTRPYPVNRLLLTLLLCTVSFLLPFTPRLFQSGDVYGLPGNRPAPDFRLADASGNIMSLADFSGRFVYLMFGYLSCADVCHTQVVTFQEIDRFADIERQIAFVFVSIDPERDDAARLAAYFDQRGDNFVSLKSMDTDYLQSLALDYNGYFYRETRSGADDDRIMHAGYYYLIDPQGRIRYTYAPSQRQLRSLIGDLKSIETDDNPEL